MVSYLSTWTDIWQYFGLNVELQVLFCQPLIIRNRVSLNLSFSFLSRLCFCFCFVVEIYTTAPVSPSVSWSPFMEGAHAFRNLASQSRNPGDLFQWIQIQYRGVKLTEADREGRSKNASSLPRLAFSVCYSYDDINYKHTVVGSTLCKPKDVLP